MYKIAFVGNPNTGKSSIINALVGAHKLSVGNWNGVTFEKKTIKAKIAGHELQLTDLPGLYSFDDINQEAKIAQEEIIANSYDLYINVIDATNLNRNLYLTLMLLELNLPVLIILNFNDLLEKYKYDLDIEKLSKLLRTPCLAVSAKKKSNISNILNCALNVINKKADFQKLSCFYFYDNKVQQLKNQLNDFLIKRWKTAPLKNNLTSNEFLANYYAIRILENSNYDVKSLNITDIEVKNYLQQLPDYTVHPSKSSSVPLVPSDFIINKRSKFANNIFNAAITKKISAKRIKLSLLLDKIFLNKWLGIPLFLLILFLIFVITFTFATPLQNLISNIINDFAGKWIIFGMGKHWYSSLIVTGILGGVGTILSFTPLMFILFLWINILRESGYISRVSHLLDSLLIKLNLNGKAIIPLILGFGCNVGSIYATRSIENPRQRKLTAMVSPFMSCSSRLPIYGLFVAALFGNLGGLVIFLMYLTGIVVALSYCLFARIFFGKFSCDQEQYFELPPYRLPAAGIVLKSSAKNIKGYLRNAASIIFIFSIFIWLISYFPNPNDPSSSILAIFSRGLGYLFIPLGFGTIWQLVAAIIPAIIAKEITISTLGVLAANSHGPLNLIAPLQELITSGWLFLQAFINLAPNHWFNFFNVNTNNFLVSWVKTLGSLNGGLGHLRAYIYMMFMLLTIPCITTLVALKQEFNYKVMFQSVAMGVLTPYLLCMVVYQLLALAY